MEWGALDVWIVAIGALSAMACTLPGCFLVLRRLSMMGDAISHAVLPGLAIAFLFTGSRGSVPMFIGAVATGLLTAFLVEVVHRYGKVETGAAMGVIFTSLFALGLILIRQAADRVDLDPGCVLYGALESTVMEAVLDTWDARAAIAADPGMGLFAQMRLWAGVVPLSGWVNGAVLLGNLALIGVFWKELRLASFDAALAESIGFRPQFLHFGLMGMTAVTTVAAFETVGSILVIAMLIAPAATAYLLTRRLGVMVVLSLVIAAACAVIGHWSAVAIPHHFGLPDTNTAGMMAATAGVLFVLAWLFSPAQGLVAQAATRFALAMEVTRDDVLAYLYRAGELRPDSPPTVGTRQAAQALHQSGLEVAACVAWLRLRGRVSRGAGGALELTDTGERQGRRLVRRHRLWESYLVRQLGLREDHVHASAERLEHLADPEVARVLESAAGDEAIDPHDRPIPGAE